MLTTADWLLGSNSQSAAGLSTLGDRMKREYLLFFLFFVYTFRMKARSPDDLSDENLSSIYLKWLEWCERLCLSFRKVAVIVVVFCFKHGLTPDSSSLFKNGQIVLLFIPFYLFFKCFECSMLLPEYVFFFFLAWVCALSCMHLATIFLSVWRISLVNNSVSALHQHRWGMYDMTANCFFNHEGFH